MKFRLIVLILTILIFSCAETNHKIVKVSINKNISITDTINNVEIEYMETFRNYIVKLKNSNINIETTDKSEKIILHEKLEIIIKDVIEKIDMDDIIEKIEDTYNNIQTIENEKTETLRNNM